MRGLLFMKEKPASLEEIRDMYGFAVRPQHLELYREHEGIYKEEEIERSDRWEQFLREHGEIGETETDTVQGRDGCDGAGDEIGGIDGDSDADGNGHRWGAYWSALWVVEQALGRKSGPGREEPGRAALMGGSEGGLKDNSEGVISGWDEVGNDNEESDDEFYDVERTDSVQGSILQDDGDQGSVDGQLPCQWAEELKVLVSGGVPAALRGELWQVFVGAKGRWIDGHYQALLACQGGDKLNCVGILPLSNNSCLEKFQSPSKARRVEKWTSQIEKDLPRTFPGHPALDENGLNALRRLLTAYARHNPAVGYCQAMNFLAALLLLLMPEENAFWTLTAIIDDYSEGYYSEKMVEAQVDQLVFEQLVRERFRRLATHLESLEVEVAWISGPWFLSIFVNVLPWESVLRVWDVLLYEGNRSMLFRTGLALMEMHAGALMQQRDTGDVVAILQSMGEATFDSSQLVLSASLGFQDVDEKLLEELRTQHRPTVLAALHERSMELLLWRTANGIGSKLASPGAANGMLHVRASQHIAEDKHKTLRLLQNGHMDEYEEIGSVDLQEQVSWLQKELFRALEVGKAAALRAEELEIALMEMVKEDNRRLLSAQVEKLEAEVSSLKQALIDKQEQEAAMVQVLVRMEQEQRVAEDARRYAEQEAEAHRCVANEAQEKADKAVKILSTMEKRAVMAESVLEATLNFQSGGVPNSGSRGSELKGNGSKVIGRSHSSPSKSGKLEGMEEVSSNISGKPSIFGRPFSLGWRDKSKLHMETKACESDNLEAGEVTSPDFKTSLTGFWNHVNGHVKSSKDVIENARGDQTFSVIGKEDGSGTAI